jgi:hypothetical protein
VLAGLLVVLVSYQSATRREQTRALTELNPSTEPAVPGVAGGYRRLKIADPTETSPIFSVIIP